MYCAEMNIRAEQLRMNRERAAAFRVAAEELRQMGRESASDSTESIFCIVAVALENRANKVEVSP